MQTRTTQTVKTDFTAPLIIKIKEPSNGNYKMKGRILLVEDTPLIQKINVHMLNMLGYSVDVADTGAKAISMFRNGYDLVFMDIDLPDTNGFEVTKAIRLQAANNHTPIIALTSHGEEIAQRCKAVGMDDMATKPIMINGLKAILEKYLAPK